MPGFKLSRRALLRGGGVAIALPWLEIMAQPARAAAAPAKRLVTVYTPGGSVLENWRPTGTAAAPVLSPILAPLEAVRSRVLILSGVDMKSKNGEQNQAGMIAWLTGTAQNPTTKYAQGPSIDQVLAPRLSEARRLQSLELAVRWGTGKAHGLTSPIDIVNYADTPSFEPIAPRLDPAQIWKDLFGALPSSSSSDAWDKSILDAVGKRYTKLSARLGAADRARLEAHLNSIRELERTASQLSMCRSPELVDTQGYNPNAGLCGQNCTNYDSGAVKDLATDSMIPTVGKFMMDMLVMALACDLTSVASLMWGDSEGKFTCPWLGLSEALNFYMNDGGYHPPELTTIFTWYTTQHAYLIQQLAQVQTANGSLLDETLIFFGSHIQSPATHSNTDMPFLLAGNGGGLVTGRWQEYDHAFHNDLLVSLFNLCGDPRTTFGTAEFCKGPLAGLT